MRGSKQEGWEVSTGREKDKNGADGESKGTLGFTSLGSPCSLLQSAWWRKEEF